MMTPERIAELRAMYARGSEKTYKAIPECLDEIERLQSDLAAISRTCAEVATELRKEADGKRRNDFPQNAWWLDAQADRLNAAAHVPTTPRPLSDSNQQSAKKAAAETPAERACIHCGRKYQPLHFSGPLSTGGLGQLLCPAHTGGCRYEPTITPLPFPVIATDPADDALVDGMLARARAKQPERWQAIRKRDGVVLATEKTQLAARLVAFSDKSLCHDEVEFAIKPHVPAAEKPVWGKGPAQMMVDAGMLTLTKERDEARADAKRHYDNAIALIEEKQHLRTQLASLKAEILRLVGAA